VPEWLQIQLGWWTLYVVFVIVLIRATFRGDI